MQLSAALKNQYHASLKSLRLAIEKCPDAMWADPKDGLAAFWRVAYHTLFFTHFYLGKDHVSLTPWVKHQDEAHCIGDISWENNRPPKAVRSYSREEILEYWGACDAMIDAGVDALDLASSDSGFPWYPMSKLEHQLLNIRHIQHHASALATRLRREAGIDIGWVGKA